MHTPTESDQSTESPIFDAHFGQKTGFRARMNEIKSVIPCSVTDGVVLKGVQTSRVKGRPDEPC